MSKSPMIDFSSEAVVNHLLARAKTGHDAHALIDLLEFYRPMLERMSQRKMARHLNGKVSASEVTQVAIISASQKFDEFRGDSLEQFRAWLCTILGHALTDQTRRYLASCRDTSRETRLSGDIAQAETDRPSQICSSQEQVLRLLRIVENMPAELRSVVRMRYQQDLSFAEIAAFLGLSPTTVRRRWVLAIQHIEQAMA